MNHAFDGRKVQGLRSGSLYQYYLISIVSFLSYILPYKLIILKEKGNLSIVCQ